MTHALPPAAAYALSMVMVAVFALIVGGLFIIRRNRKQGALMLVAAAVLFVNVLIWTLPG